MTNAVVFVGKQSFGRKLATIWRKLDRFSIRFTDWPQSHGGLEKYLETSVALWQNPYAKMKSDLKTVRKTRAAVSGYFSSRSRPNASGT